MTTASADRDLGTGTSPLSVSLSGVGRSFHAAGIDRRVLRDIDLDIEPGEIVAVIGPSGCGKSTLLREVSGLDTPTVGTVHIGDQPVRGISRTCAVAFQEPRLLPWRSLERNVALGLPTGTDRAAGAARVSNLLDLVGLADSAALRPRQVSGGMAQRASLARALARGPAVLVLDEPFGALDALTRLRMQDLLLNIHAAEPTTVLLVTHDVDEALYLADRIVLLGADPKGGADPGAGADPRGGAGATIQRILTVPGARPRDRGDAVLAQLRAELLEGLGVLTHHRSDHPASITETKDPR